MDLAIDVLSNCLLVLVELDELAGANSRVIGVEAGASRNNVKDIVDILSGLVDETILRSRMTTWDCLAGDFIIARSLDCEWVLVNLRQGYRARCVAHDVWYFEAAARR